MATAVNAHIGVGGSATGLTSASVSPSGDDRYMFGVACALSADPTAFKYGGSTGTDLTQIGTDTGFGVFYTCNFWDIDPGPTGSTTAYAAYSATGSNALSAVFCTGVDQTTPTEALQTNSGANDGISTTAVATITVTGLVSGQVVVAGLAIGMLGEATISSVVAGADTTVERTDIGTQSGERQSGTSILTGTATGTSLTLSATITVSAGFSTFNWYLGARPTLEASASGSTGTVAYTNAADTSAASGTTTVAGTLARTNAADTSAASGTTTVTGTLARTNANDTSAAAGTTAVVGTLAYTNADDTAAASGTAGTPTGTVAYTNANDGVAAAGVAASGQASGGTYFPSWPMPPRKQKRSERLKAEALAILTEQEIEAKQKALKAKQELRRAEAKDRHVVAQLRQIYAEQDALVQNVKLAKARIAALRKDDEEIAMILALAG